MLTCLPRPASAGNLTLSDTEADLQQPALGHRTLTEAVTARQEVDRLAAEPTFGPPTRPAADQEARALAEETGTLGPELTDAIVGNAQDMRWQTALIGNSGGSQVAAPIVLGGDALASPALNRLTVGDTAVATGAVTRTTANATLLVPGSNGEQALSVNSDPYTRGVGYQARLPVGSATVSAGVDIYGGRHIKGVAVSSGATLAGAQFGLGLAATLVTRAGVTPTGKLRYSAEGELEMLATHTTEVMPVLSMNLQGAEMHAGGGLRLVGIKGVATEYEKFVPIVAVGRELRAQKGWLSDLRETGRALGLIRGAQLPKARRLARAEAMQSVLQVGEMLTWQHNSGLIFGLSAGAMGARVNLTAKLDGLATMSLTRPDEQSIELAVTSSKVHGLSMSADLPLLAEAYHSLGLGLAQRRVFRFDLEEPAAQDALREALQGKMPARLAPLATVDGQMAERFMGLMASERLPRGVENVSVEAAEEHVVSRGFASFRPLALSRHLDGIAHQRSTTRHQRVVANAASAVVERGMTSSKQTELLRTARDHTATAVLQTLPTLDAKGRRDETLIGVRTVLTFDHKRSGQRARQKMTRGLQTKLGHTIDAWRPISSGNSYKLTLSRLIRPADLERLAASSDEATEAAAAASRLPPALARALVAGLEKLSPVARGEKVVAFIAQHRSRAVGTLQQLLGDDMEPLEVSIDSSAYDRPVAKLLEQTVRLAGLTQKGPLKRELGRIIKLEDSLEDSLKDLAADSIFRALDEAGFLAGLYELGEIRLSLREVRREVERTLADLAERK